MKINTISETINQFLSILTKREHTQLFFMLLMMLGGMLIEMLGIGIIIPIISFLLDTDYVEQFPILINIIQRTFGDSSSSSIILFGVLCLLVIFLSKALYLTLYAWKQNSFIYGINRSLGERLFLTYIKQPYIFHVNHNSSRMIQNIIGEVSMFSGMVMESFLIIVAESLVLFGILALLLYFQPLPTIIISGALIFFSCLYALLTKNYINRWGAWRQIADTLRVQRVQEGINGIKESLLLGRTKFFQDQFNKQNLQSTNINRLQSFVLTMPRIWLEFIAIISIFIIVFAMSVQESSGVEKILPNLALFGVAAFRILPSVNRILNSTQQARFSIPNINKIYNELKISMPKNIHTKSSVKIKFKNKISLNNITFSYPGSKKYILNKCSLSIIAGECIGIVGVSGAGKSTLVDNILGLFKPDSGTINVDGVDIQNNLRSWQDQIGYVSQNIYLIDASITSNVAFGISSKKINIKSVNKALKMAQLDKFISSLPDGIDTILGERGVKLSGGQKQRIGIARALYHNPSVIVLDEATNALDTKTEVEVMKAVLSLKRIKTIIMIAHRISTLNKCDRIFRLTRAGKVKVD